jgi:hypothetical protein
MVTSLEHSIHDAVLHYIAGRIRLDEFQEWLASNAWDVRGESADIQRLVNEIELLLAEFSNGHWTESELRHRFQQYRPVVQPIKDVGGGVLWSEVRAPYVYVATSGTSDGYGRTTYPSAGLSEPKPKLEPSVLAA